MVFSHGLVTPRAGLLALAAIATSLGCARPLLTCPREGGPAWRELDSKHFALETDLAPNDARVALAELERTYQTLEGIAFPRESKLAPERVRFVLFDRLADYKALAISGTIGVWQPGLPNDLERLPTMRAGGRIDGEARATLTHELTHDFAARALGSDLPKWLNEGLAAYYETMQLDGNQVKTGLPAYVFSRKYSRVDSPWIHSSVPIDCVRDPFWLVAADADEFMVADEPNKAQALARTCNYAGSWALVTAFLDPTFGYRERFERYVQGLHAGKPNQTALRDAFEGTPKADVRRDLRAVLERGGTFVWTRPMPTPMDLSIDSERELPDEEVHLLWARLWSWKASDEKGELARHHLDVAAAQAPDAPEVRLARALRARQEGKKQEALDLIRGALSKEPNDARYLLAELTLEVETDAPEADELATVAKLEKVATTADELEGLARFRLNHGRGDEALELVRRALARSPTCGPCLWTLTRALHERGDLAGAISATRRMFAVAHDRESQRELRTFLRKLLEEQKRR